MLTDDIFDRFLVIHRNNKDENAKIMPHPFIFAMKEN